MADAPPESPESKSLREKAESLERLLADARAAHAARQQAKADANEGDGDAAMPDAPEASGQTLQSVT